MNTIGLNIGAPVLRPIVVRELLTPDRRPIGLLSGATIL